MIRPQTIQIFLPDGSPTGVKEAEITNRLIKVILFPRTSMDKVAEREMVTFTGVYFLFGEDEEGKPMVYIGEGENCWDRIKSHHRSKDFWTHAAIATTKTDEFTKTDGKFLEHICLAKAKEAERFALDNDTGSREPSLPESRKYDLLDNFDSIKLLISTLGYPLFDNRKESVSKKQQALYCKGKKANASAYATNEGYLVLKGSVANLKESKTVGAWVINMRKKMITDGVLLEEGDVLTFTKDHLFSSPSGAAAIVLARSANGWIEWRDKEGKTLDELKRR